MRWDRCPKCCALPQAVIAAVVKLRCCKLCPLPSLSSAQFLESYKSVTLASMAATFGVSPEFLDAELVSE